MFDQLTTLAHELGHAFHNECQTGLTMMQRHTPMTLAETASIFNESLIQEAALKEAGSAQETLAILECSLVSAAQVIVDIHSRFLFEREVFERRREAELSADDLCDLMRRCPRPMAMDSTRRTCTPTCGPGSLTTTEIEDVGQQGKS